MRGGTRHTRITLVLDGTSFTLPAPEWGYTVSTVSALRLVPKLPRGYTVWDDGAAYDYRVCKCSWMLNASDTAVLATIARESIYGRGNTISMSLPVNSGFYPFGPDWGDAGTFTVRILEFSQGKQLEEPYGHYNPKLAMICVTHPAYTLPSAIAEGDLTIGGVSNLRWPPDWPDASAQYDVGTQVTRGGVPYSVDKMTNRYESAFGMICNHSNAAALINHLVATVRSASIVITAPANTTPFGIENAGPSYSCVWTNHRLEIKHELYNRFSFSLQFFMVSESEK